MAIVRFYRSETPEHQVSVKVLLQDFLEQHPKAIVPREEIIDELVRLVKSGEVTMEPSIDDLIRERVLVLIAEWEVRAQHEHARRFIPDRAGGRFDRRAGRFQQLLVLERQRLIGSVWEWFRVGGPGAYRSQARLLGELDPDVNSRSTAKEASDLVRRAVVDGIETGRNNVEVKKAS